MPEGTFLTHEQLQQLMEAAIRAAKAPNPIEEKQIQEQIERERRRNLMMTEMGRIEEQSRLHKQNSCSHKRHETKGHNVARHEPGVWTTGGNLLGAKEDVAGLICVRCATTWKFRPTPEESEYFRNAPEGMNGFPPPPEERCIKEADAAAV
jgi:hypothetical protein